jgi:hypothetical protein
MDKYQTITDLPTTGALALMQSVSLANSAFFPMILFMIWIFGTASSYFTILKTTGKKRFWQSFTAMSFATFILSLSITAMNTTEVTILSGYWVGFFILSTLLSWYGLSQYK